MNHLSLFFPIITFVILLGLFFYKNNKKKWYIQEIFVSIKGNFIDIWYQFSSLKSRKKYLVLGIVVYVLVKVFMVFSINTNMPTFDEDAVAWWDMKTKIFASTQSLVLDKTNPEYLGADYGRYPFAGITDTYFLLPYGNFVNGLWNIIASLMYILALLLLFGIFLRKTNFFVSIISLYLFTSLPFVFIHWFGSYRNFPAWVFLFIFIFYLIDQLFHVDKEYGGNTGILFPILSVWFISSVTRNEGVILTGIMFLAIITFYHIFKKWKTQEIKKHFRPLIPIILWYIFNKIIFSFYPVWTVLNTWGTQINFDLLNSFFTNIAQSGVFVAPFQQMFYHPDYILLFVLFVITLIMFFRIYKHMKKIRLFWAITMLLLFLFMFTLYANVQSLWLLTHYAFIRYPVSIVLFLLYTIVYSLYLWKGSHESWL